MADSELADLDEAASLGGDELLYVVDDPAGTPVDRKATVATVLSVHEDAADPHPGLATDVALTDHAADSTGVHGIPDTGLLLTGAAHDSRDHSVALGTAALADLGDVAGSSPSDGDVLTFDTVAGWQPEAPSGGGGSGHTIKENGTPLTARAGLNFASGLVAADDAGNDETDVNADYGSPGNSAVGDAASDGAATSLARSDHSHGREGFGAPGSSAVGDAVANGVATTVARSDHKHGREGFGAVTAETSFGQASANGAATTLARSDHTHGTPANPVTAHEAAGDPHTGYVLESLFDANTILAATSDNTPLALTVAASTVVGRKASGDIAAMSAAETLAVLGLVALSEAKAVRTTAQTLTTGVSTALSFASEEFDDSTYHDNATNPTRLTVPATGRYLILAGCSFASNATGRRLLRVQLNGGSSVLARNDTMAVTVVGGFTSLFCGCEVLLTAADYIELFAFQDSGGNLDTAAGMHTGAGTAIHAFFSIRRIT